MSKLQGNVQNVFKLWALFGHFQKFRHILDYPPTHYRGASKTDSGIQGKITAEGNQAQFVFIWNQVTMWPTEQRRDK